MESQITGTTSAKILVVDDDLITAAGIQSSLEDLGYKSVRIAGNSDEVINAVKAELPDIILMDINLRASIDGIETSKRIHKLADIPVIFATAYSDNATIERAKKIAPYGYLIKPFDERDLYTAIEVCLSKHALEQKIIESEVRFRTIFEQSPISIWEEDFSAVSKFFNTLRSSGVTNFEEHFTTHPEDVLACADLMKIIDINETSLRFFGFDKKEDMLCNFRQYLNNDSLQIFKRELIMLADGATNFKSEMPRIFPNGEKRLLDLTLAVVPGCEKTLAKVLVSFSDITERKQAELEVARSNRALRILNNSNQALVRLTDEKALLNEICRILVEIGGYRMVWVGYTDFSDGKNLQLAAQFGFKEGFLESENFTWTNNEWGRGPNCVVIKKGEPDVICDILSDPSFERWRDGAVRDGYQSILHLALTYEDTTFGTLAIYSDAADTFDSKEIVVLQELANDLAFGMNALRSRIIRMQAEDKLIESEERYHSIVSSMAEGVIFQDAKGKITEVNDAAKRIEGRLDFEIIGRNLNDPEWGAIYEDGSPFPAKEHPALVTLRSGEPQYNVVMGIHKPDGTLVWLSINSQPLFRPRRKKPYAVVTTFHDITERKEADEALKESALKWDTTFHSIKDHIFLIDNDGVILQTNKNSFNLFGKDEEEITGHYCYEIVHNSSEFTKQCPMAKMKKSLQRESAIYEIGDKWFEATVDPIMDENKNLLGAVHIISDITERKLAEDEFKKQVKEIDRFNKLMMGRESKMIDLKKEVNELLEKVGKPKKYNIEELKSE